MAVQPGLCRTWSETPKTGFLTTRLIFESSRLRFVNGTDLVQLNRNSKDSFSRDRAALKKRVYVTVLFPLLKEMVIITNVRAFVC